ncbi:hypothetical protein BC831DRAFT_471810 [Entophlyctis helioformis]|nr:hypothetical protein BC831DRAFT_471810 [Entophlyctis helioformis]
MNAIAQLLSALPVFAIDADSVAVLDEPHDFREALRAGIRSAKHRICLASLYVGSSETALMDELAAALAANPDLQLSVLVDGFRGTRSNARGESSSTMFATLARRFPGQVQLSLYRSPAAQSTLMSLVPQRFNEVFGLQHIKAYLFDDHVLVSGANLSGDYFTNRQDRYVLFRNSPGLAAYFADLIDRLADISAPPPDEPKALVSDASGRPMRTTARMRRQDLLSHARQTLTDFSESWIARTQLERSQLLALSSPDDPSVSLDTQDQDAGPESSSVRSPDPAPANATLAPTTFATPAIQLGVAGITYDQDTMLSILAHLAASPNTASLTLASGYLNLPEPYRRLLVKCQTPDIRILCSSPEANGFYGSKGVYLELLFVKDFTARNRLAAAAAVASSSSPSLPSSHPAASSETPGFRVMEYTRAGWTWHAKGLWLHETAAENGADTRVSAPYLTAIGSSNFNQRSLYRDVEAQVYVYSTHPRVRDVFQQNLGKLTQDTRPVSLDTLKQRRIPALVKLCARALRTMF